MKDTSSGLWSSCCPARLRADAGCILSPASTAPPGARFSSVELIGDLVPGDPRAGATLIDRLEHDPARPSAASPPADCGPWPAKTTPAMRCKRPQPKTKTCRSAGKHGSHSDSLAPHASTAQAEPQPTATARQVAIGPQAQSGLAYLRSDPANHSMWRQADAVVLPADSARPAPRLRWLAGPRRSAASALPFRSGGRAFYLDSRPALIDGGAGAVGWPAGSTTDPVGRQRRPNGRCCGFLWAALGHAAPGVRRDGS